MLPGLPRRAGAQVCSPRHFAGSRRAPNHRCGDLVVPDNVMLLYLPPYSPELNPKENLWDESREKIFKNYALKSMDAVRAKLRRAILYVERNPKLIRSITSFPYIVNSL
jgi:transposase